MSFFQESSLRQLINVQDRTWRKERNFRKVFQLTEWHSWALYHVLYNTVTLPKHMFCYWYICCLTLLGWVIYTYEHSSLDAGARFRECDELHSGITQHQHRANNTYNGWLIKSPIQVPIELSIAWLQWSYKNWYFQADKPLPQGNILQATLKGCRWGQEIPFSNFKSYYPNLFNPNLTSASD